MQPNAIILPVAIQALLAIVVLILMGPIRARSMRENRQSLEDPKVRVGLNAWSEQALKVSNNYKNQFELPVLFYAVVALLLVTGGVDHLMVALAWVFVVSRIAHAAIHIGPNVLMWRGTAFAIGAVAVVVMWIKLVLHTL